MPYKKQAPRKSGKQLASKQYVKNFVGRATSFDKNVYYADEQSTTVSNVQQYVDISANMHASKGITGTSVENLQLVIKGYVQATDSPNAVRMVLFKWRSDTVNAIPSGGDVLRGEGTTNAPYGLPHWERRGDYKILADRFFHVSTANTSAPLTKSFSINISGKKLGMSRFNQGSSNGRDHIYMLLVSDSGGAFHPIVDYNLRLLYKGDE